MKKTTKKQIEEALEAHTTKNRLQELAGVKKTGCIAENLEPGSATSKEYNEGMDNWIANLSGNRPLSEREEGAPTEDQPAPIEPVCVKDVDLQGGTATGCWSNCNPGWPFGNMCEGCDCWGEIGTGGKIEVPGDIPPNSQMKERMNMGEGDCVSDITRVGNTSEITFKDCKQKCEKSSDCTGEGCSCVGIVSGGSGAGGGSYK